MPGVFFRIVMASAVITGTVAFGEEATLYVATDGNDAWSGALKGPNATNNDGPFATIAHARDAIRQLKKENRLPENGAAVGQALRAQFVNLGAICAVVEHDDQNIQIMPPDRLQFLHMHQQAAVAVEHDHGAVGTCSGNTHGERDTVADGTIFANGEKPLLRT